MIGLKLVALLCVAILCFRITVSLTESGAYWLETRAGRECEWWVWWLDLCAILLLAVAVLAMPMPAQAQTRDDIEREIGGAFDRSEISRTEHAALALAVLATAADIYTTRRGLAHGCVESNPLYGSRPSSAQLALVGAVPLAAGYYAADRPGYDVTIGALVFAAWRLRAAYRNSRLDCYG